jgi:catechol 2,3-dioxygenase-like lactoylglutathione lyase family enzyme
MRIDLVTVVVDEYDPAIAFFVDVLGFELVEDSPSLTNHGRSKRCVVVRPPGPETGLFPVPAGRRPGVPGTAVAVVRGRGSVAGRARRQPGPSLRQLTRRGGRRAGAGDRADWRWRPTE